MTMTKGRQRKLPLSVGQIATAFLVGFTLVGLIACGGDDGDGSGNGFAPVGPSSSYSIGGTLSGLNGGSAVLQNNGTDSLVLNANGTFAFSGKASNYNAAVLTQPLGFQWCGIANGSGTATANVSSIVATCTNAHANVTTFAGTALVSGYEDGKGASASFFGPLGITADAKGNLFVADVGRVRKIDGDGNVTTLAGQKFAVGHADGPGSSATFSSTIYDVAADAAGNVYVADQGNSLIRKIDPNGFVSTLAGQAGVSGHIDGPGTSATFDITRGLTVDASGNVYVSEWGGTIRKIDPNGNVTTLAGHLGAGYADGQGATATFNAPVGMAVDASGNVYVAEWLNHTIRKIDPSGNVTTLAGTAGVPGHADGQGTAATFDGPWSVAVDAIGNVYVGDENNRTIRKIDVKGNVTTLAGQVSVAGHAEGQGSLATFSDTKGIASDLVGNLYVSDAGNNTIRKLVPTAP